MTHGHRQQCGDGQREGWRGGGQRGKTGTSAIMKTIKKRKKGDHKKLCDMDFKAAIIKKSKSNYGHA